MGTPAMQFDEITTDRLTLVAMTETLLTAEQEGRLAEAMDCTVPEAWPPESWEPHVFDWLRSHYAHRPAEVAWHRYIALRGDDASPTLIGTVGGFTQEGAPGQAEIGYSLLGAWQGKGYATEAARAVIAMIRESGGVTSVVAHTFPHLTASVRVMERCGLAYEGPGDEGTVRYRLRFRRAE